MATGVTLTLKCCQMCTRAQSSMAVDPCLLCFFFLMLVVHLKLSLSFSSAYWLSNGVLLSLFHFVCLLGSTSTDIPIYNPAWPTMRTRRYNSDSPKATVADEKGVNCPSVLRTLVLPSGHHQWSVFVWATEFSKSNSSSILFHTLYTQVIKREKAKLELLRSLSTLS